ncbi:peptide chain release factor 2 [Candidatus Poribacteria bacterium]|nr:peptide chain release factor 2 [Candidatus Poribacteria bacterium]MYA69742.1 peptide chain release factor 2 [Candidatus Poribacteria bacterium]MYH83818.1 peptide chain release factor 2 [Candidatus Poribacteria bacterium]MYK93901.1 peptide chain release factor 2 [Candidatus Poribacteria bacterium]
MLIDLKNKAEDMQTRLLELEVIFDLAAKRKELTELEEVTIAPDFWSNTQRVQKTNQRIAVLRDEVSKYEELSLKIQDIQTLIELAIEENDESLQAEIGDGLESVASRLEQMELQLMLNGEFDENNAILNIHSGAGGIDAQDWAGMLMRMYLRWCDTRGYQTQIVDITVGDEAGIKGTTILVTGPSAYGYLQAETGVHRLVRLSPYDFNKRRHTSFAAVDVTPEIDDAVEVDIQAEDLRIDTYRASGAGGQHVNVTDSAIRITHKPTGIIVQCQNERSQHKNREIAMKLLRSRLHEKYRAEREAELAKQRSERLEINFGSQIRSYVMHPYQRVKDLRTNVETGNVSAVLDGALDPFIESYLKMKAQEK